MSKNTLTTPHTTITEPEQSAIAVSSGGAAQQNTVRNIGLIISREYKNRVRQRSFIISTILLMILIAIGACIPTFIAIIASKSYAQTKLAVVNNAGPIANLDGDALNNTISSTLNGTTTQQGTATTSSQPHFSVSTQTASDTTGLQNKVKKGDLNILLVIDRAANKDLQFTYYDNVDPGSSSGDTNLSQVQALTSQLNFLDKTARLGLTSAQTQSLFVQPTFSVVNTQQSHDTRTAADRAATSIIAYAGVVLIFMTVFLYGIGVATGVAEEKGSRIMEILVNAATPFQLMVGKIIGIGAAGLTQMVCLVAVGIGVLLLQTPLQNALLGSSANTGLTVNIASASISLLFLVLLYFILGYLLYSSLFAAMGALVKRQDEVQNAITPINWIFMIGYFISFAGIATPDATWMRIVSFIPFWTPTTMLMRMSAGSFNLLEIGLSVVLMIVAIIVCAWISARIYRYGVLMYGQKPKLGQLAKLVTTK